MKQGSILLVVCCLFLFPAAQAQISSPQPKFHNFTINDGLPSSETYFVHEDREGYIWVCTDRGVARYDGNNFRIFTTKDGLADNVIFSIYEDHRGRLWFISYNSELSYYENGKIHPYKYNNKIREIGPVQTLSFKQLVVDKHDNLYYSLNIFASHKITPDGKITKIPFPFNEGFCIFPVDENQYSWQARYNMGTAVANIYLQNKQAYKYIGATSSLGRRFLYMGQNDQYFMNNTEIYSIRKQRKIYTEKDAIALYPDGDEFWIGTYRNGVKKISFKNGTYQETAHYFSGYSITSILRDHEGGYWFSTLDNGILYTPGLSIQNYTKQQGLLDDDVISVAGANSQLYIGYKLGTWQQLRPAVNWIKPETYGSTTLLAFFNDVLYISLGKLGVHRMENGNPKLIYPLDMDAQGRRMQRIQYPFPIIPIESTKDFYVQKDYLLFGMSHITKVNKDNSQEILYAMSLDKDPPVIHYETIMLDEKGTLWGGSNRGLYILTLNDSKPAFKDSLFRGRIRKLTRHPRWGNIAATRGNGLLFFNSKGLIRQLTLKDGLLSDQLNYVVADDNGDLWVASNKGINCLKKDKDGKIHISSITTEHGLISNEINSLYISNDTVWAGTKVGLAVINLLSFRKNTSACGIYLTNLSTNNQIFEKVPKDLHFPHNESFIQLNFRTTNYKTAFNRSYQYRFSKTSRWISVNEPTISLTNPQPGDYALEVRFQNEDKIWCKPVLICQFTIDKAFWNEWYFITGVCLLFVGIVYLLVRYRFRQLSQRHNFITTINQLERKALRAQMNPHFIFNALNSIQSFLVYQENEKAEKYLLKFATLIRQTLNNSRESHATIQSEIKILTLYLELEQMRFQHKFRYEIINELSVKEQQQLIPNMLVQPYVENAVLHAFPTLNRTGLLTIRFLSKNEQQIICIVEDNGIGRKKAAETAQPKKHTSFGTTITEERLRAYESRKGLQFKVEIIDLEPLTGTTGTRVVINIPVIS